MGLALLGGVALLSGCLPRDEGGCPYCPGGGGHAQVIVPFETIVRGEHSGIRDTRILAVRDMATWAALWAEHVAGQEPRPAVPAVDFVRDMVIGFFWGEKPTSGYEVEIAEIVLRSDRMIVRVEASVPGTGAMVPQVLTQPHHIVRLSRSDLPVEFVFVEAPEPKRRG